MSLRYIIDGYNIIKHPLASRYLNKFKDSRYGLLRFIRDNHLTGSMKNSVLVVFDGYRGNIELGSELGIEVIFSQEESADEKIKKLIQNNPNNKSTIVVSDDREIRFFVKGYNSGTMTVEDFISVSKKNKQRKGEYVKEELSYSQRLKIDRELAKLWLKE